MGVTIRTNARPGSGSIKLTHYPHPPRTFLRHAAKGHTPDRADCSQKDEGPSTPSTDEVRFPYKGGAVEVVAVVVTGVAVEVATAGTSGTGASLFGTGFTTAGGTAAAGGFADSVS